MVYFVWNFCNFRQLIFFFSCFLIRYKIVFCLIPEDCVMFAIYYVGHFYDVTVYTGLIIYMKSRGSCDVFLKIFFGSLGRRFLSVS